MRREAWRKGVYLFNEGDYWECHEVLEPAWLEATGTEKHFLGGMILLAAALHKARHMDSPRGGRRNFAKSLAKLALVDDGYNGVDVRELEAIVHDALRRPDSRPQIPHLQEEARGSG